MCFSATASFLVAGAAGAAGVVALTRVRERRAVPLAAAPLLFGAQQAIEGLLWLELPVAPEGPASTTLTLLFLLLAEVLWPVYAPLAALLVEPAAARRRLMAPCLVVGVGVAAYMLWGLLTWSHAARVLGGHIVYATEHPSSDPALLLYLVAVASPLLLSSHRTARLLGAIVGGGAAVAWAAYHEAYVSVWCFFAAAASAVIVSHFEIAYRQRARTMVNRPA